MKKIRKLDSYTIDQIAAGEVIDGPYSCVKELVDNAIDAEATDIVVEIALGGRELIRVIDNGIGMRDEDLLLSVERYATSKISSISDLHTLSTMGFRGEALSSIASVSQFSILSASREDTQTENIGRGSEIIIHGGKQISFHTDLKTSIGTRIEIRSLFYNLPARRKFMKSPTKDATDIYKTVCQLALCHPHVSFQLISDGIPKACFSSSLEIDKKLHWEKRVEEVLGKEITSQGMFIQKRQLSKNVHLYGFIGFPHASKSTRSLQHLIVNQRPIQSLVISYAVKNGYATAIGKDEYPIYVLFLEIDPESVDVNVHPQKKEIRFCDEEELKKEIERAVSQTLFAYSEEEKPLHLKIQSEIAPARPFLFSADSFLGEEGSSPPSSHFRTPSLFQQTENNKNSFSSFPIPAIQHESNIPTNEYRVLFFPNEVHTVIVSFEEEKKAFFIDLQYTWKAIYILKERDRKKGVNISSETLLIPHLLKIDQQDCEYVEESLLELEQDGFSIRPFGHQSFMIESIPQGAVLGGLDIDSFFQEWCRYKKRESIQIHKKASLLVHSLGVFQKNAILSKEFVEYIVREWIQQGRPSHSLSGEKIAASLDNQLLSSLFTR